MPRTDGSPEAQSRSDQPSSAQNSRGYASPYAASNSATPTTFEASATRVSSNNPEQIQRLNLIRALSEHRINTVRELCHIERSLRTSYHSDVLAALATAWVYYVNSNSLLNDLRRLTTNYPFSSECLDDAKRRVFQDVTSSRSWNYCWLVLDKIDSDHLIDLHANQLATRRDMWNGIDPSQDAIGRLAVALKAEWQTALTQMLRNWDTA